MSHPGRRRERNEDCFLVGSFVENSKPLELSFYTDSLQATEFGVLTAVADGMGGHAAGYAASRTALQALSRLYYGSTRREVSPTDIGGEIEGFIEQTHQLILNLADEDRELHGMGTTLTGIAINGDVCTTFNVGDSRIYRHRRGMLDRLTRDDSLAETLRSASSNPKSHMQWMSVNPSALTKVLGGGREGSAEPEIRIDVPIAPGDQLMLCSDGLHTVVTDATINEF